MSGNLEHLVKEIRDYDARLIKCCREIVTLHDQGAGWARIDAEVGFMDTLQAHRRGVLAEYARLGGKVKDVHAFGACVDSSRATPQSGSATSPRNDLEDRRGAAAACAKAQRRQCVEGDNDALHNGG